MMTFLMLFCLGVYEPGSFVFCVMMFLVLFWRRRPCFVERGHLRGCYERRDSHIYCA